MVEWSVLFPEAEVIHLDEDICDHLLLHLRLKQNHVRREKEKEAIYVRTFEGQEESCRQTIKEAEEATSCSQALSKWNQKVFGEVKQKIKHLTKQLRGEKISKKDVGCLRKSVTGEVKKEVFWVQRAKADFLKHRDSNSR